MDENRLKHLEALQGKQSEIHFSLIGQSYDLMQRRLQAAFPKDSEEATDELWDLNEDERILREQRRQALHAKADQITLLFIEGLRSHWQERSGQEWRGRMLYRLAALFELATVVDPAVAESLAGKIDVSYQQAVASAVLKTLAQDIHKRREQVTSELVVLDTWWHDAHRQQLNSSIAQFLLLPPLLGERYLEQCLDEFKDE